MGKRNQAFTLADLKSKGITILNDNGLFKDKPADLPKQSKIRNATKTKFNGIEYKSKLEAYFAQKLTFLGVAFGYETETFVIMEGFTYIKQKIRAMTYTPDFTNDKWVVELKGFETDYYKLKAKLFKKYMVDNKFNRDFRVLKSKEQIDDFIREKYDKSFKP